MKKTYLVTYDYKGDPENYLPLFEALKKFPSWWHYLDGTWLIKTEKDAKGIFQLLRPHLDQSINLLVIEVGKERKGWLPKKAWRWIKRHIDGKEEGLT